MAASGDRYAVSNALFEWEEGERRVLGAPALERPAAAVQEELRRRLGSTFTVDELAELYGGGVDWATDLAGQLGAGADSAWVVAAAFGRYSREAANFAGGRRR